MNRRSLALRAVKSASALTDPILGGRRKGPRILIYHQVGAGSGYEMDVSTEAFRQQLEWLVANGRILSLDAALTTENLTSDDVFVLTFDDGHRSLWDNAFPLMRDLGLPFVLYVSTGPLAAGQLHGNPHMPLLSWSQINEMLASKHMTVGAHTHDHLDLRRQPAETIASDLATCDAIIEERTEVSPVHFTYPWGRWSARADGFVRQRYETATVGGGPGMDAHSDLLKLPRVPVMAGDTYPLFKRKMWGGFRLETSLRSLRDRLAR